MSNETKLFKYNRVNDAILVSISDTKAIVLSRKQIREIALSCGFTLKYDPPKDSSPDLKPYVYNFAWQIVKEILDKVNVTSEEKTTTWILVDAGILYNIYKCKACSHKIRIPMQSPLLSTLRTIACPRCFPRENSNDSK